MMNTPARKNNSRNQAMECCKLVASFFVVFNHAPFPGGFGDFLNCLCTFAVPTFFMISGYFNYGASGEAIARRLKHILKLLLIGTAAHILYTCVVTELEGGSTIAYLRAAIPDPDEIVRWIVLQIHPYAGHLWYLNAIAVCYLCFWGYTLFSGGEKNYRPFYSVCGNLFTVLFVFETILPVLGTGSGWFNCRNGWFFGLPMFGLGLFLREYQEQLFARLRLTTGKLVLLVAGGAAFTVLQWKTVGIGLMPLGMLVAVVALMLLMVSHPKVPVRSKAAEKAVNSFGALSTWIYIVHLLVFIFYGQFCQEAFTAMLGDKEPWLRPLFVLAVSMLVGVLCEWVPSRLKRLGKKLHEKE